MPTMGQPTEILKHPRVVAGFEIGQSVIGPESVGLFGLSQLRRIASSDWALSTPLTCHRAAARGVTADPRVMGP